ncbi:MAG: SRPBCC domain-containing protein [Spirosomataceae bacterium]
MKKVEEFIVRKKIVVKAEPSVVWDALTNPKKTRKYFFNCEVFSDWEKGSTIVFRGQMFLLKQIEMKGFILEIIPEQLLKYSLQNGTEEDSFSTVTEVLTYENGETTLTVTDDVGQGEGADKRYKRSAKAWNSVIKGLKELIKKETGTL